MSNIFIHELLQKGWKEVQHDWQYHKNDFILQRDTSSWWILSIKEKRIFDIAEPVEQQIRWMVNLIEYLCEIHRED
jgi:hypothetical protein